jgi:hypothetical protein
MSSSRAKGLNIMPWRRMRNWKQSTTQGICNFGNDWVAHQAVSRRILKICFQAVRVGYVTAWQVIPQARLFFPFQPLCTNACIYSLITQGMKNGTFGGRSFTRDVVSHHHRTSKIESTFDGGDWSTPCTGRFSIISQPINLWVWERFWTSKCSSQESNTDNKMTVVIILYFLKNFSLLYFPISTDSRVKIVKTLGPIFMYLMVQQSHRVV